MHFWINKPAGRYYGFTGRRYPATPAPKLRNQCRGGELRQMVTPVHRFQGLAGNLAAGNASSAGPSNANNSCRSVVARSATTSARTHNNENRHHGSSSLSAAQLAQLNNIPNNVTDASNNRLTLPNMTRANDTEETNRSLLETVFELPEAELAGFRLRCGVWSTFAVATVFVAGAKFYFGYRGPGLEILVFCGLLILLLSACLYSIFCRYHRESHYHHGGRRPEHNARMQEEHIVTLTSASGIGESVAGRPTATVPATTVRQNPPPPPYHIAILIPPPSASPLAPSDEAPPPSYDKIMR